MRKSNQKFTPYLVGGFQKNSRAAPGRAQEKFTGAAGEGPRQNSRAPPGRAQEQKSRAPLGPCRGWGKGDFANRGISNMFPSFGFLCLKH